MDDVLKLFYLEQWVENDYGSEGWEVYDSYSIANKPDALIAKAERLIFDNNKINLRVIEVVWEN